MKKNLSSKSTLLLLFFSSGLLFFPSCKKYQPADDTFFMKASTVKVATTTGQGTASHKITDLWLYVNGNYQGAYPVGSSMPVVTKNNRVTIELFAGIKNNGISETRIPWLVYQKLKFDTLIANGVTIERPVTFVYNSGTQFAWNEDFESSVGVTLVKSVVSDTSFRTAAAWDAFEGKSIELGLDQSGVIARIESAKSFTLPVGNSNVYLELNYKGTAMFEVGLIADNGVEKSTLNINPQSNWNKIYIQLTYAVSSDPLSSTYKVYFKLLNHGESPKIFLDNIKLVYI